MAASGDVLAGKYRLGRLLASGGMGEVWLAQHVELGSRVAVKLMSRALIQDATARARFRREARAAARLRSSHIVAVQDFGEDDGAPYLVMEFLEGETLQEHVDKNVLSLPDAADLADQAARGLGVAHAQGVVHRDIKPSNLLLANVGGQSVLKIIDFGIARALLDEEDAKVTRSGAILGSPAFMSPEQASGDPVTHSSDLWSLAAVLYWMVIGREPFSGRMMSETLHRIRTAQYTKPTDAMPDLSSGLDDFFAKAFRLKGGERYGSAERLSAAFRAALIGPRQEFSSNALDGKVSRKGYGRSGPRRRYQALLLAVLIGSALAAATVALLSSLVVRHDIESSPAAKRMVPVPPEPVSAGPASKIVPNIPSAAPAPSSRPPVLGSSLARRPAAKRDQPERSALTQEPLLAKPGPSGESIDPLFGIRFKRLSVGGASASEGSRRVPDATAR